jgi:hypothetical protein
VDQHAIENRSARLRASALAAAAVLLVSGCGWFGGSDHAAKSVSVFSVSPGQCFVAPTDVKAELSELSRTPCEKPHAREAYAVVPFASATGSTDSAYPGADKLSAFAQGSCAQSYRGYVGVDYLDSSMFFTYLFPSARSWEQDNDRKIICFVTTAGGTLTASVKGSNK